MTSDKRLETFQDELKLLKGEVRQVLLDLRAYVMQAETPIQELVLREGRKSDDHDASQVQRLEREVKKMREASAGNVSAPTAQTANSDEPVPTGAPRRGYAAAEVQSGPGWPAPSQYPEALPPYYPPPVSRPQAEYPPYQQAIQQALSPEVAVPQPQERPAPEAAVPQPQERPTQEAAVPQPQERPAPEAAVPQPQERPTQEAAVPQPQERAAQEVAVPQQAEVAGTTAQQHRGRLSEQDPAVSLKAGTEGGPSQTVSPIGQEGTQASSQGMAGALVSTEVDGSLDINLMTNLMHWTAVAKRRIGVKPLADLLELYIRSGHDSPGLRSMVLQICSMVEHTPADSVGVESAHEYTDLMHQLHGILTSGRAIVFVPQIDPETLPDLMALQQASLGRDNGWGGA